LYFRFLGQIVGYLPTAVVKEQHLDQVPESVEMNDYDLSFDDPSLQLLHVDVWIYDRTFLLTNPPPTPNGCSGKLADLWFQLM